MERGKSRYKKPAHINLQRTETKASDYPKEGLEVCKPRWRKNQAICDGPLGENVLEIPWKIQDCPVHHGDGRPISQRMPPRTHPKIQRRPKHIIHIRRWIQKEHVRIL